MPASLTQAPEPCSAEDYAQRFVSSVRRTVSESGPLRVPQAATDLVVTRVFLDGGYPTGRVVVVFATDSRPGCEFGVWRAIWSDDGSPGNRSGMTSTPEQDGSAFAHWVQQFITVGLPADCEAGSPTWVTPHNRVVSPVAYESRLLGALRAQLKRHRVNIQSTGQSLPHGLSSERNLRIQRVTIHSAYPTSSIRVVFEDTRRSCRYGLATKIWADHGGLRSEGFSSTPERFAAEIALGYDAVTATNTYLDQPCHGTEVVWVRWGFFEDVPA
jgi:hypothetical protein